MTEIETLRTENERLKIYIRTILAVGISKELETAMLNFINEGKDDLDEVSVYEKTISELRLDLKTSENIKNNLRTRTVELLAENQRLRAELNSYE